MTNKANTLEAIFGPDAYQQMARYYNLLATFERAYGPGPTRVFRAPGRVNLIGEHTDYNHGFVMPLALEQDVWIAVRARTDARVRLANTEAAFPPATFTISPQIPAAAAGHWSNYARGAAQRLAREHPSPLRGMDALVDGAAPWGIPRGSGLSSSSALTVVIALALAALNHLNYTPTRLAHLCHEAEWYTGTRGGIMDQFNALLARRGHALFLDTRPDPSGDYHFAYAPLPAQHEILLADSGVRHRNVGGEFNRRVAACRAAVALLRPHFPHITHLRDVQEQPWPRLEALLPEQTTPRALAEQGLAFEAPPGVTADTVLKVRARARHVHSENRRVLAAVEAMRAGDAARLGALMTEAHRSARDDYEISLPELDALVESALTVPGVRGARLTGAGWGGSVVILAHTDAMPRLQHHLTQAFRARFGRQPSLTLCRPSHAAGEILPPD